MQGFQLLYDAHSGGFTCLASYITQYLADEFGSKALVALGATPTNILNEAVRMTVLNL